MKTLNRTLSLALVFALVFSLMSFAFAADTTTTTTTTTTPTTTTATTTASTAATAFTDASSISHTNAVSTMTSLSVIKGYPDGSYKPATNVTRAEMAKMICLILNGGKEPVLSTSNTPKYTDIKGHWAQAYIEYCAGANIVAGMGDGTFHPDDTVTASQAAKMLLVAMGYKSDVFGFTGADWEVNVNVAANKANIYKDITDINASANLNRDNAAQMIYNAIFANTMSITYTQDQATGKITQGYTDTGAALAVSKFSLYTETATLGAVTYNSTKKEYSYALSGETYVSGATSGTTIGAANMKSTTDYSAYVNMKVKILWNVVNGTYTVFGVYPYDSSVLLSGVVGVMADGATITKSGTRITAITYGGTTYKFDTATVNVYTPNSTTALMTVEQYLTCASDPANAAGHFNPLYLTYSFKMLDTDANGSVDKIVVYPYTVEKVTYVGATTATFSNVVTGTSTSMTISDIKTYTGIATGDYVKHTAKADNAANIDTYEKISPLAGKVEAKSSLKATVSGVAAGDVSNITANAVGYVPAGLTLGATYENIIQVNGFIYCADLKVDAASADKFAEVTKIATTPNSYGKYVATLLFADGTTKEVTTGTTDLHTSFPAGSFVTYTVSSSVYTLTDVAAGNKGNFDHYYTTGDGATAASYSYTKGTINSIAIDDGAVVFANTDDGYKVITGATLKTAHGLNADPEILTKTNTSTGFNSILCACVDLRSQSIGTTKYGYVTANLGSTLDKDKNTVSVITFWNGSKDVTKTATANYADLTTATQALTKGMFFTYTEDTDGLITVTDIISGGTVDYFNPTPAYISAVSADGKTVAFNGAVTADTVNSDTVIFNIDSANCKGIAGNAITKATGTTLNAVYADKVDGSNTYVLFVAVDVTKNVMTYTAPTAVSLSANPTAAEVTTALANYTNVTVNGAFAPTAAVTVNNGKTLTVKGNLAPTAALTVNGTVNVAGDYAPAANTAGTGTVTATGAYTPTAANDGTTTTATIKAASFTTLAAYTVAEGATLEITGATTNGAFALTVNGTLKTGSIADANVGQLAMGAKSVLNLTGAAATTAVVTKLEAITTAGAQVTFATATTSVAGSKWFTAAGAATTATPSTGTVSTPVGAASTIAAGTYKYGTYGFSTNNLSAADQSGWFKQ